MLRPGEITLGVVKERLSSALGRMIGPRRDWTVDDGAEQSKIDVRTIQSYQYREAAPGLLNFLRMSAAFGPGFASHVMGLIGMTVVESGDAVAARAMAMGDAKALAAQLRQAADAIDGAPDAPPDAGADTETQLEADP